jgi:proteasome assembly chaperone (PAC2) family protein
VRKAARALFVGREQQAFLLGNTRGALVDALGQALQILPEALDILVLAMEQAALEPRADPAGQ